MSRPATEAEAAAIRAYASLDDGATQDQLRLALSVLDLADQGQVKLPEPYTDSGQVLRTRLRNKQQRAVAEGDPYKYGPPPSRRRGGW